MSISLLQHTQSITGFKHIKYEYIGQSVIQHLEWKSKKFHCPCCNSRRTKARVYNQRTVKGLAMGRKSFYIKFDHYRIRCKDCKAHVMQKLQFIQNQKSRITKPFARSIIELRQHMTITATASYFGVHWELVKNLELAYLKKKFRKIPLKSVKHIGIDEIHTGDNIGENGYLTIVRDLDSGATLFVGKGRTSECLDDFGERIKRSKCNIKAVAVDMAPSFTHWANKYVEGAVIVYDHFHVIKLMNKKLNEVRIQTMNKLNDEEKKDLKGKKYSFLMNKEDMSATGKEFLDSCKEKFSDLGVAYYLKESLRNIYRSSESDGAARIAFKRWCDIAINSGIAKMKTMANTINQHIEGIVSYWTTSGLTSAKMEGFNTKVKLLIRNAYGYHDEDYLILKIHELPEIKNVTI